MSTDGQHNLLPDELERALRRATDRTAGTLTALRRAVRDHVHRQRAGGNDLDEIQLQLRTLLARALEGTATAEQADGGEETLTRQVLQWSSGFYTERALK